MRDSTAVQNTAADDLREGELPTESGQPRWRGLRLLGTLSTAFAAESMESKWKAMRLFQTKAEQLRDYLRDHGLTTFGNKELLLKKAAGKLQELYGNGKPSIH